MCVVLLLLLVFPMPPTWSSAGVARFDKRGLTSGAFSAPFLAVGAHLV